MSVNTNERPPVAHPPVCARMLVPLAIPTLLDYAWPADIPCKVGAWAEIQVGKKIVHGVVVEVLAESPFSNLKPAIPLVDIPNLTPTTLAFYRWATRYNLAAPGEALRVALPKAQVPRQKKGRVGKKKKISSGSPPRIPMLTEAQQTAVTAIEKTGGFHTYLLDGVTGSGKTEVYFNVIEGLLAAGGQVLVLVPEIALTPQWLDRFQQRFGFEPWVWHSGVGEPAKRRTWHGVATGEKGVVIGARSALFLPFQNLKCVVVDEEHDPSYKQESGFRYHGRDLAVQLGNSWQCPVILASATPSLESWQRTLDGKYTRLTLPNRFQATLAPIHRVDLTKHKLAKHRFISQPLQEAMAETLAKGQQTLLFLNRRGHAPLLMCTDCGTRRDCPRCDATLIVHGNRLICHHCGFAEALNNECAACGSESLMAYGPGTRRVAGEVTALFPTARVAVADTDAITTVTELGKLIDKIAAHEVDIVVGTQMVTKGHHFPNITLVGVIDGDMGLAHGELRASERTFQLLTQVAGRAGRGESAGRVLIQTHTPNHPLFEALAAHDRDGFYATELDSRRQWGDPPFGHQVAVIIDGLNENEVIHTAHRLAQAFPKTETTRLLGPAPAPLAKIKDKYRYRLLVKALKIEHAIVKGWIETTRVGKGVRVEVDINPVSLL